MSGTAPPRVIVVGAGLAGLGAAWRLQSAGARVTVFEARERAGGALAGDGDPPGARVPAVVPRQTPCLTGLAHELGASALLRRRELRAARIVTPSGVGTRPLEIGSAIRWLRGPRLRRLQSIIAWLGARVDPAQPDLETRLDDRSVADACEVYLGRAALDGLLAPLLEAAWGLDARETSRQLLFTLLSSTGEVELDALPGIDALVERLADALLDLRTGERVASVLAGGRGVRLASGAQLDADATVIACAPRDAAMLTGDLTHVERELLAACPRSAAPCSRCATGRRRTSRVTPGAGPRPRTSWPAPSTAPRPVPVAIVDGSGCARAAICWSDGPTWTMRGSRSCCSARRSRSLPASARAWRRGGCCARA